jgi:hypothetical protein
MERAIHFMISILLLITGLQAQERGDLEEFGFIDIKTDSMDVPFFVDGFYVGNHPLKVPVPVLPGYHEVSYIPPDIQHEKVRDNLTEGIKRVYVAKNDTLEVFLFYDHYLAQVETLHKEIQIQNYVGLTLALVLVYIIFSIF